MFTIDTPTTCFGETLQAGALKLAQFCGVKSAGLFIIFAAASGEVAASHHDAGVLTIIFVVMTLLSVIKIFVNILLYKGAKVGNARWMKPWFWVYFIQTVLLGLAGLIGSMVFVINHPIYPYISVGFYILTLVFTLICKHFCFVVLGLIYEVERGQVHGESNRPARLDNEGALFPHTLQQ